MFAAALVIHIFFVVTFFTDTPESIFPEAALGKGRAADFFGIYQSGVNLVNGHSIYCQDLPENLEHRVVPYFYYFRYLPPVAALSAISSRLLAPWPAYWVWVVINELLLLITVLWILRWDKWPAHRRVFAAALWLGYFPLYIEQYMGQFSLSMALFLLILWKYDDNSKKKEDSTSDISSCNYLRQKPGFSRMADHLGTLFIPIVWSASILLKFFPILMVIPYYRDKLNRRIIYCFCIVLFSSTLYFASYPNSITTFIKYNLRPFTTLYKGDFGFQALIKVIFRAINPEVIDKPLSLVESLHSPERITLVSIFLLILILAIWKTVKISHYPNRRAYDLMIWTTVFFLVYKTIWEYHYLMILPAITAIILCRGTPIVYIMGLLIGLPSLFGLLPTLGVDPLSAIDRWPVLIKILYFGSKSIPVLVLFSWTMLTTPNRTSKEMNSGANVF